MSSEQPKKEINQEFLEKYMQDRDRILGLAAEQETELIQYKLHRAAFDRRVDLGERRHRNHMIRVTIAFVCLAFEIPALAYIVWMVTP